MTLFSHGGLCLGLEVLAAGGDNNLYAKVLCALKSETYLTLVGYSSLILRKTNLF